MGVIQHAFTSPIPDDPSLPNEVRPSNWNSAHAYTLQDAVSLLGNTAGTLTNISSGTLYLAGGNNITLSQSGNTVSISGGAGGGGGNFSAGASTGGNTLGNTGTVSNQIIFAGGNNVTLSQSTNAAGATLTISGPNTVAQSVQTQNLIDLTLAGNTAGALALASSGTVTLAGGNNVTLSQAGNAVTISAFNQTVQTQNLCDLTLAGNTAGALALVSSGTATLAGGNNITLSQAGNAITISGPNTAAQTVQTQLIAAAGVSNVGNTAGNTATTQGTLILAGGNNITLSQSTAAGSLATITISGPNTVAQTVQTQLVAAAGVSNVGNTLGNTATTQGTIVFAGGNNITLSQSTAAGSLATITISGPNTVAQSVQTQLIAAEGVSNVGNTAGNTATTQGTLVWAGGNNITLSQSTAAGSLATITISAFNQTAESNTFGMSNLGNTAGTSGVVSANQVQVLFAGGNNVTLSQSIQGVSATITISGANTNAGGTFSAGVSNIGNTAGNTKTVSNQLVLAGGNNITLSQSTAAGGATVTISAQDVTFNSFDNAIGGLNAPGTSLGTLWINPLNPPNPVFPGKMTVSTLFLDYSINFAVNNASTDSHTYTVSVGFYTVSGSTASLINSGSTSWSFSANANNSTLYNGMRYISLNSSLFASSLTFSQARYYMALWMSNSNVSFGMSHLGFLHNLSAQRSGTLGTSIATATSMGHDAFKGAYSVQFNSAMPASIHMSAISKVFANMNQIPHVVFDAERSAW